MICHYKCSSLEVCVCVCRFFVVCFLFLLLTCALLVVFLRLQYCCSWLSVHIETCLYILCVCFLVSLHSIRANFAVIFLYIYI